MRDDFPVRIGVEALAEAKKAAACLKMNVKDYMTKVVLEAANRDLDEFGHAWLAKRNKISCSPAQKNSSRP